MTSPDPGSLAAIARWDADGIRSGVSVLAGVADRLPLWQARVEEIGRQLGAGGAWSGRAGGAAAGSVLVLSAVCAAVARGLEDSLAGCRQLAVHTGTAADQARAALLVAAVSADAAEALGRDALEHAACASAALEAAVAALDGLGVAGASGPTGFPALAARLVPVPVPVPPAGDPGEVAVWWAGLPVLAQAAFLQQRPAAGRRPGRPARLGPRPGQPAAARPCVAPIRSVTDCPRRGGGDGRPRGSRGDRAAAPVRRGGGAGGARPRRRRHRRRAGRARPRHRHDTGRRPRRGDRRRRPCGRCRAGCGSPVGGRRGLARLPAAAGGRHPPATAGHAGRAGPGRRPRRHGRGPGRGRRRRRPHDGRGPLLRHRRPGRGRRRPGTAGRGRPRPARQPGNRRRRALPRGGRGLRGRVGGRSDQLVRLVRSEPLGAALRGRRNSRSRSGPVTPITSIPGRR